MKIFVVEPYARTPGHYDRLAARTCEAFGRLKNQVTLVTYSGIANDGSEDPLLFKVVEAAPDKVKGLDAEYRDRKIYLTGFRAFLKWHLRELRTIRYAASLLRRDEQSVAHFYDADAILLAFVIRFVLRSKRKTLGHVLVMTIHQIPKLKPAKRIKSRIFRWVHRRCLERLIKHDLDGTVVLDPSLKQVLVSHFRINEGTANRIRVLPHGIGDPIEIIGKEDARRSFNLDPDETIFLIFGVLRKDKRVDLAIEAIQGLPHCRLVIAGGAQDFTEATLKDLIQRCGCERSVSIEIDYISERRMHHYFSACDAVIIPYDRSFKGLSGILTLACGHGKSVIASDVTLLGDTVRAHGLGFTVEPENVVELREAMLRFLSLSPEECAQMEQRVWSYAELMSWDSVCVQWVEFYRELLSRRNLTSEG